MLFILCFQAAWVMGSLNCVDWIGDVEWECDGALACAGVFTVFVAAV